VEQAALEVLEVLGFNITILPIRGAGASLISKGFISSARKHAARVLEQWERVDPENKLSLICLEPPEISAMRHDYYDLLQDTSSDFERRLKNAYIIDEFIVRKRSLDEFRVATNSKKVLFHPHCHQKSEKLSYDSKPVGEMASIELLRTFGYEVELSEAGCCGMAGTFGYETDHYDLSQQIGELKLLPKIRQVIESGKETIIASTGSACRLQIRHGSGVIAVHPIQLVRDVILMPA
jgi:Fe-S oxidoreductase